MAIIVDIATNYDTNSTLKTETILFLDSAACKSYFQVMYYLDLETQLKICNQSSISV